MKFDLNPSNYPDKYIKFVIELRVIIENIDLANDMLNGSDHTKPIDDGMTSIIHNIRDLGKNLMKAIEYQIKDDKLMSLCLAINDDIALTMTRYSELKKKMKPRPFRSALKDEEEIIVVEKVNSNEKKSTVKSNNNLIDIFDDLNIGSKSAVNTNVNTNVISNNNTVVNNNDIFDFFGQNNSNLSKSNNNQSQDNLNTNINIIQNNKQVNTNDLFPFENNSLINNNLKPIDKNPKLTDLISSLYENDYGNNNNSNNNLFGNVNKI